MREELEKRVDQAVDNFMLGYGCCHRRHKTMAVLNEIPNL